MDFGVFQSWRWIAFSLLLIFFGAMVYWLQQIIPEFVLIQYLETDTEPKVLREQGWSILTTGAFLPFLIGSFLIGAITSSLIDWIFLNSVFRRDKQAVEDSCRKKIASLRQSLDDAENAKDQAITQARKTASLEVDQKQKSLDAQIKQIAIREQRAQEMHSKAQQALGDMKTLVRQEQTQRQQAEHRARNATMALRRKEAKFQRKESELYHQIQSLELTLDHID